MAHKEDRGKLGSTQVLKKDSPLSFRGNFVHTIDTKGRVSLPAEFRRVLKEAGDDSIVITNYISQGARCLEGFGISAWQDFEAKLREKSRFNAKIQKLENFYISRAAQCPIDKSGRVLIPEYLRQYASICKDVTFTSSIYGFRIWDSRIWSHIFNSLEEDLMDNPELFADIDI